MSRVKKGSWITLSEFDSNGNVVCVKSAKIDGIKIKEDTYYCLYNKKFQEVRIIDNISTIILHSRQNIAKGVFLNDKTKCFVFQKDNVYAHGKTIKQAYRDWLFKTSNRDCEEYKNLKPDEVKDINYWAVCYRTITGACALGTENFISNTELKPKMTLKEVIELTRGQYNSSLFEEFFKNN